jgi:hypothetical protein
MFSVQKNLSGNLILIYTAVTLQQPEVNLQSIFMFCAVTLSSSDVTFNTMNCRYNNLNLTKLSSELQKNAEILKEKNECVNQGLVDIQVNQATELNPGY